MNLLNDALISKIPCEAIKGLTAKEADDAFGKNLLIEVQGNDNFGKPMLTKIRELMNHGFSIILKIILKPDDMVMALSMLQALRKEVQFPMENLILSFPWEVVDRHAELERMRNVLALCLEEDWGKVRVRVLMRHGDFNDRDGSLRRLAGWYHKVELENAGPGLEEAVSRLGYRAAFVFVDEFPGYNDKLALIPGSAFSKSLREGGRWRAQAEL